LVQDDPRVIVALEAYLEAMRAGRPWSRDEFLSRHAEISEALAQCLSGVEFIQAAADQLDGSYVQASSKPAEVMPPSAQLGDYRILREIGRGGMGVVYEAEQLSLGRRVALKVLPFAAAIDPRQRQRFQIEAQAAAQLHHPHIVPVFGVGCDQGIHYYAMQFVEGRSLAAILQELRAGGHLHAAKPTPSRAAAPGSTEEAPSLGVEAGIDAGQRFAPEAVLNPRGVTSATGSDAFASPTAGLSSSSHSLAHTASGSSHQDRTYCRNVARLGADAADALEHAHDLGILHRDIKPANLLIDFHGAVWVTDFGLARFPSDLSLTATGDMVGTLRYMSPEQSLARSGIVDQRTDIYSLGVTLYELLTLRPAFNGRDHQELLRQIAMEEPIPPRRLNPAVPRDLETVILKATAKDPSNRYTTAREMAADFRRFLEDRPILARRPGPLEHTLRWALRRKELVATTAAILILALIIGSVVTWDQARKTDAANRRHHAYIIETYPLIDRLSMESLEQATKLLTGTADAETRESALQEYREKLKFYQNASELPRTDAESRRIIARAYKQLGFVRGILSGANRAENGPDRALLSQAEEDYGRSIALYETLLAEAPNDPKVRRHFAEALGTWGWGWLLWFTHRPKDAEPHYRRALELWRELVQEIGTRSAGALAPENAPYEYKDLIYLASAVHMLAGMLDVKGQSNDAEALRRQLIDDTSQLAARLGGPAHQARRRKWGRELFAMGTSALRENDRRVAALSLRLAIILDPENDYAHNSLAWVLVSMPCDPTYDPTEGMLIARKALALAPDNWMYWNTLGVAAYRNRDWKTASESLVKSMSYTGGDPADFFFLAMTCWNQGQKAKAREWFDRAVAVANKDSSPEYRLGELHYFHAEAAALLGLPGPAAEPPPQKVDKYKNTPETAHQPSAERAEHEKG
jgi:serine/threonine protein kinase/Tfp pilus assembly protein PilF